MDIRKFIELALVASAGIEWLYWRHPEIFRSRRFRGGESFYCSAYDYEAG